MNDPKKAIYLKRGCEVEENFPSKSLVPAIKKGELIGSNQISADGKSWIRLDKHSQLAHLFESEIKNKAIIGQPESSAILETKPEPPSVIKATLQDGLGAAKRGDYEEAYKLWLPLAEQEDATAQFKLGLMYDKGQGVPQDYEKAVNWYSLSAEQGLIKAQYNLGSMYANGHGVLQDYILAHMWWNIAGSSEYRDAAENRNMVEKEMSPPQIEEAREMAREWMEQHKKNVA
jgi:hypothetical protein